VPVITTGEISQTEAIETLCLILERRTVKALVYEVKRLNLRGYLVTTDETVAIVYDPADANPFRVAYLVTETTEEMAA